ncbi:MAG TPA: cobamide remodeling phosphodiesterase CbiR [Anaerolineales bacterium]|nr:cobamide remodeling phosphodiesterase CbiR [Anaerolineales bacterium]
MKNYPFRLGTTSYIIPDDILPNALYLAGKVRDIELILFEVDDGPNNLPSPEVIQALSKVAQDNDLTYTVHLPLDLKLGEDGSERDQSLVKAKRVIDCTRGLDPWAYVMHLDGKAVRTSTDPDRIRRWQDHSTRALEIVSGWAGSPEKLAVENLETYPLDFIQPVLDRVPVSRCVDIGHLWLDGHDPIPYLQAALPRTRVIHMHGIAERDHRSLAFMFQEKVRAVWEELVRARYDGVLTLEIFSEEDFLSSIEVIEKLP